jgi:hypothetical protein
VGYFEGLTSSSFKTTEDGRKLFFPWGPLGRGYVVPSDEEVRRLQGHIKAYHIVTLVVVLGAVAWGGVIGAAVALPILIAPYVVWVRAQCGRLAAASEKLTLAESIASQARAQSVFRLWALGTASLLFVSAGLFIVVVDPANRLPALASVSFFGLCVLMFGRMLVIKRRTIRGKRS